MLEVMRRIQVMEEREKKRRQFGETPSKVKKKPVAPLSQQSLTPFKSPLEKKRSRLLDLTQYERGFVPFYKRFPCCAIDMEEGTLGTLKTKAEWKKDDLWKVKFTGSTKKLKEYIIEGKKVIHDYRGIEKLLGPKEFLRWAHENGVTQDKLVKHEHTMKDDESRKRCQLTQVSMDHGQPSAQYSDSCYRMRSMKQCK